MSVIPEQATITPEQFQQAVNRLVLLQQAMLVASPVHLSSTKSVSLARVEFYGSSEIYDEKPAKKADDEPEMVSFDPPRYKPAIWLASGEVWELETEGVDGNPSENEIFREAWEQYAHLTNGAREILTIVFPVPEEVPAS